MRKYFILTAIILAFSSALLFRSNLRDAIEVGLRKASLPKNQALVSLGNDAQAKIVQLKGLPVEFNLAVPFTSQAPFEKWDLPYKEACEEASILMVDAFYKKQKLTKKLSDEEIKKLVEWQKTRLGHFEDTNVEETARIMREYYGYKDVRVVYDITIDDIKREVAQGRPVILPAAGRLLGNKYFRQPGPLYHMLVVRGWTKKGLIITNDPGTKRGEGYLYKPDVLMKAVHDLNEGDVYKGRKAMIVVDAR